MSMGQLVPVDHDPFAPTQPGMQLNEQPAASSFADISNNGYINRADQKAMAYDMVLNGGKGMASIINQSPAHEGARSYQRKVGEEAAALEERKRAGEKVMGQLTDLTNMAAQLHKNDPQSFVSAIGPYNTMAWNEHVPFVGGMTAPQVTAAYGSSDKAWNIQNRLNHMIHGLTTSFVASAGKGAANMSDSRQKVFEETMGAMMKATTKEEFDNITHDAAEIIRKTFNLPPAQAQAAAHEMGNKVREAAGQPPVSPPQPSGMMGGLSGAAAPMAIPPAAVDMLKANKSKAMREFFDQKYGKGASDRVLRGG